MKATRKISNPIDSSFNTIRDLRNTEENILKIFDESLKRIIFEAGAEISLKEIALLHIAKTKVSDEIQKLVVKMESDIEMELFK